MGIIIRKINDEYWLESVSHSPINLTPFTQPEAIQDFCTYYTIGKIKDFTGLELDKEYSHLDCYKDFEVVERIPQVKHENGYMRDVLVYSYNPKQRKLKLKQRKGFLNRHTAGLPKEKCIIKIVTNDTDGEHIELCSWAPFDVSKYNEEFMSGDGYLGTATTIEHRHNIGFHVWEQNNYEFVYYKIV